MILGPNGKPILNGGGTPLSIEKDYDRACFEMELLKKTLEVAKSLIEYPRQWKEVLGSIRETLLPELQEMNPDGLNAQTIGSSINWVIEEISKAKPSEHTLVNLLKPELVFILSSVKEEDLGVLDQDVLTREDLGLRADEE